MEQRLALSRGKIIGIIILMVITWSVLTIALFQASNPDRWPVKQYVLDEHWNMDINGVYYEDIVISDFHFPVTQTGDVITLTRTIPEGLDIETPFLKLLTVHSAFRIYLDNEMFYEYGIERMEANQMIGYGKSRVPMPGDYAGKTLKVVLYVTEDSAFEGIQALSIVDGSNYFQYEFIEGRSPLFISLFLMGFGVIGMLFSIFSVPRNNEMIQVFCVANFALLAGIWTLCNAGIMELLIPEIYLKSLFEYVSLYAAPLPLILYFGGRMMEKGCPKFLKILFGIITGIETVFLFAAFILHYLNIVHLPKLLIGNHIIFGLSIAFVITVAVVYLRRNKKIKKSFAIGMGFICVMGLEEILSFNLSKFVTGFKGNKYNGTICILALIVVIMLFFDFVERMHEAMIEAAQKRILENLAYMDELTSLANRRKIDDTLVEFKEQLRNYAVVSLDMNFLKTLNDTYGHEKGDEALQFFAVNLNDVFGSDSLVGRMGGDEFAIVMEETTPEELEEKIEKLTQIVGGEIFSNTSIHLTFASGYAFSYECTNTDDAYEIYRKSDARMYENKRIMKMNMNMNNT